MQDVFIEKAEVLRRFLERKFVSEPASDADAVDIQACFFNFTFDSIMRIFFGEDTNTAEGQKNSYGQAFDDANAASRTHGVDSIAPFMIFTTFLPWPFGGKNGGFARAIYDFLSPQHRQLRRCTKILDREANRLVKNCLEDPKFSERKDLLVPRLSLKIIKFEVKSLIATWSSGSELLHLSLCHCVWDLNMQPYCILSCATHTWKFSGEFRVFSIGFSCSITVPVFLIAGWHWQALFLQAKFSSDFVKQMVLHLIIAGRDTTACLLSWMVYELTKNQDVQQRLHDEIMQKLPPGKAMDWKSLSPNEMPYLNGVIYEALRIWPPVPFDLKMAFEDDVLPGGWKVPKFASVAFIPYNMGRDPERYPEPLHFRPERWIPFNAPPQHEFPVFQAGPRICLGMDMDTWLILAFLAALPEIAFKTFQNHRFPLRFSHIRISSISSRMEK